MIVYNFANHFGSNGTFTVCTENVVVVDNFYLTFANLKFKILMSITCI